MNCQQVRTALTSESTPAGLELSQHLEHCDSCRQFRERMESARLEFRRHLTVLEPDGSFSARVLERLPGNASRPATEVLGWAALRLLPVTLVAALLLGGWSLLSSPDPETLLTWVDQDPIPWILGDEAGDS